MEIVTKIAPIALALIMLTLGLGLTIKDFTRVISQTEGFSFRCHLSINYSSIIAFILIKIFKTPLELALGVMIIAAAPWGNLKCTN